MNSLSTTQHGREGLSMEKAAHFIRVLSGHTRSADAYLDKFIDFDVEVLRALTGKQIDHLLVDIDACIAPAYAPILVENISHAEALLSRGLQIGIYSNCKGSERLRPLHDLDIKSYEGKYSKPDRRGFLEACERFQFDPTKTWMIGENPNTDGGAIGVLGGMAFVKPIPEDSRVLSFKKKMILSFQRALRQAGIIATTLGNDRLIGSAQVRAKRAELEMI